MIKSDKRRHRYEFFHKLGIAVLLLIVIGILFSLNRILELVLGSLCVWLWTTMYFGLTQNTNFKTITYKGITMGLIDFSPVTVDSLKEEEASSDDGELVLDNHELVLDDGELAFDADESPADDGEMALAADENPADELAAQKLELLNDLRGPSHDAALKSLDKLRGLGWLEDGFLRRARLLRADLHDADLSNANLRGANFGRADLHNTNLNGALLHGATLSFANLSAANLNGANLDGAVLRAANLNGADLSEANLHGVVLDEAYFDDDTILPDGSHWTPDADLTRFIDSQDLDFWRSEHPTSPAYRAGQDT